MKVFTVTVIILTLMIIGIGVNRSFILTVSQELYGYLDRIESTADKYSKITEAEEYWERNRFGASLSVSHEIVEEIDRRFIGIKAFCETGREADFKCEIQLFRDGIKKMSRLERFIK